MSSSRSQGRSIYTVFPSTWSFNVCIRLWNSFTRDAHYIMYVTTRACINVSCIRTTVPPLKSLCTTCVRIQGDFQTIIIPFFRRINASIWIFLRMLSYTLYTRYKCFPRVSSCAAIETLFFHTGKVLLCSFAGQLRLVQLRCNVQSKFGLWELFKFKIAQI